MPPTPFRVLDYHEGVGMTSVTTGHDTHQFIGDRWVPSQGGDRLEVVDPTTEQVIAHTPAGTAADVDAAVEAAAAAQPAWAATPPAERAKALRAVRAVLADRADQLAEVVTRDVGTPLRLSQGMQVGFPLRTLDAAADLAETFVFEKPVGEDAVLVREAYGVVGAITPWNFPLHQIVAKVAYAWAAGNTVVLKPSEVAPLVAWHLAEAVLAAGLPPGLLNIVGGTGPEVGEAIAGHPGIAAVSFTGSGPVGARVSEVAAQTVKRVSLELGGKGAAVMLPDADLAGVAKGVVQGVVLNSGQACGALTRLLVPAERAEEAAELAASAASGVPVGDPSERGVRMGPLVSATQRQRVRGHIERALEQGATLVAGGVEAPEGLSIGYFVAPTVFAGVTPEKALHHEEVFGPVLAIESYTDVDDAVRLANATDYGLTAGVWSADETAARAVARRLQAGQVWLDGRGLDPTLPFGGYKGSGLGRENGEAGLEDFLEHKVIR